MKIIFLTYSKTSIIIFIYSISNIKGGETQEKVDKRKLEIAMARAQLNRNELSQKAKMPVPTICNVYKRGSCKPATVGKIAEALGVDVTEIIETEE